MRALQTSLIPLALVLMTAPAFPQNAGAGNNVDEDFVSAAAREGLLDFCCFRSLGGLGLGATASGLVLEELCAACAGLGNIVGAI